MGPFENAPLQVFSAKGKKAKLHSTAECSTLGRRSSVLESTVPLNADTIERMCRSCADGGSWTRPITGLSVFLRSLTWYGLLYELSAHDRTDMEEDLSEQEIADSQRLLLHGDWPDEDEEEYDADLWAAHEEARAVRDHVLFCWTRSVKSLHTAAKVLRRYPWLADWARDRMTEKAQVSEEWRRRSAGFVKARDLLEPAAAALMPVPDLPFDHPEFAAFGGRRDAEEVLKNLWRSWRGTVTDGPRGLDPLFVEHHIVQEAFGKRRKGRDQAAAGIRELMDRWAQHARQAIPAVEDHRWLLATLPPERVSHTSYSGTLDFAQQLTEWELAVVTLHGAAMDWDNRSVLLRVPDLVARRLLAERSDLHCTEVDAAPGMTPEAILLSWAEGTARVSNPVLSPGVLDDTPLHGRRLVSAADVEALQELYPHREQPYAVLSVSHGFEVLGLTALAERCAAGWKGIILASAEDLPFSLVADIAERVGEKGKKEEEEDTSESEILRFKESPSPESPDFGSEFGMREGERLLRDRMFPEDRLPLENRVRLLGIARVTPDLRGLGGRYGRDSLLPPAVWDALVCFSPLDMDPFLTVRERAWSSGEGLALPLAVLADVQLYTTSADPGMGKGHTPMCRHARSGPLTLDADYDLFHPTELLQPRQDWRWCSRCGGYAVRRLDDGQLAYYRAAHRLDRVWSSLQSGERAVDRESFRSVLQEIRKPDSWTDDPRITEDHEFRRDWTRAVDRVGGPLGID